MCNLLFPAGVEPLAWTALVCLAQRVATIPFIADLCRKKHPNDMHVRKILKSRTKRNGGVGRASDPEALHENARKKHKQPLFYLKKVSFGHDFSLLLVDFHQLFVIIRSRSRTSGETRLANLEKDGGARTREMYLYSNKCINRPPGTVYKNMKRNQLQHSSRSLAAY